MGTLFYSGGYVEVLYFLTGEHRAYIRESGLYDRIVRARTRFGSRARRASPTSRLGSMAGRVRYNYLNLNDKGINGGVLNDLTLGLNWFLNPNMKFQWNYSITDRHSPAHRGSRSDRATVRSRASACDRPWTTEPPR